MFSWVLGRHRALGPPRVLGPPKVLGSLGSWILIEPWVLLGSLGPHRVLGSSRVWGPPRVLDPHRVLGPWSSQGPGSRFSGMPYRITRVFSSAFFFSIRVFFTDTGDSLDSRGSEGTIFYSTLPFPPAHKHWNIYLQLCMWHDYHVFLTATLVFTRLRWDIQPYRITIWVIDWWCNASFFTWWIEY